MDPVHDRASMIIASEEEEEDRISKLPDDIILRILSFLDLKYAVQTSILLSNKQSKHIWTSMRHLSLNTGSFPTLPQFDKFVRNALSHCNQVSSVELIFCEEVTQSFSATSIVDYAYLRNVREMSVRWSDNVKLTDFPKCLFSSHTLKHLTLTGKQRFTVWNFGLPCIPKSAWDFPVLETLDLRYVQLGDGRDEDVDLFSKCVKLKDLTLHGCCIFGMQSFSVCAPRLCNLTITHPIYYSKVFNVVAPQLENITTSVNCNTRFDDYNFFRLSTTGLDSLEKVDLSKSLRKNTNFVPQLLDLFQKLRSAKFLILDKGIIEALSKSDGQLLHEPCPFKNLKCVKQKECIVTMPTRLQNYFLESSPSVTFHHGFTSEEEYIKAKLSALHI